MPVSVPIERLGRKLRVGFVGGGLDSVIGQTHLISLRADGMADVVAGAFSVNPEVGRATGRSLLVAEDRIYESWRIAPFICSRSEPQIPT
jgi:predicted dehydrogenase